MAIVLDGWVLSAAWQFYVCHELESEGESWKLWKSFDLLLDFPDSFDTPRIIFPL